MTSNRLLSGLLRRRGHLATVLVIALATLAAGVLRPSALDDLATAVVDAFQRHDPPAFDPESPVRVVAVDEKSLAARGQWPWPRSLVADLLDRLAAAGAAAIAVDVTFAEPDRSDLGRLAATLPPGPDRDALARLAAGRPDADARLAEHLSRAPVVLGATLHAAAPGAAAPGTAAKAGFAAVGDATAALDRLLPTWGDVAAPLPVLAAAAPGLGVTNWLPDHDQIVRRIPLVGQSGDIRLPSLALEALRLADGASTVTLRTVGGVARPAIDAVRVGRFTVATDAHAVVRPRFRASDPAAVISADDVLAGRVPAAAIDGRIVFVGTTAIGLGDIRATAVEPAVPGVELHARVVEQILAGGLLVRPDWAAGAETLAAVGLVLGLGLALPAMSPLAAAGLAAALVAALFAGSHHLFRTEALLLDAAYPSIALAATLLLGTLALWRDERRNRRAIRNAFGKFLSPAVVDRLADHPERLVLGGETRELTVMFTDLRDFTTLSEGLSAAELTAFMNDYLTPMTDAVLETGGTVDKYIGDAVVAFWNAPLDDPDHTPAALTAALRMRRELDAFRARRAAVDAAAGRPPRPVAMGLGLTRGPCSVGNMGSSRRFDYSILGDTANLASRLEGLSRLYGVDVVAAAEVRAAAPDLAWLELDVVRVKGRSAPTTIHTLVGDAALAATPAFRAWAETHAALRAAFAAGRLDAAAPLAETLAETVDPPWRDLYRHLADRIATAGPVGPGWSPIRILDAK